MYPDTIPIVNYASYSLAVMWGFFSISDYCIKICDFLYITSAQTLCRVKCIQSPAV